ncbi:DEAD/DEAH box helicase family protein [Mammaliicoccus lentus]|uniref:DEAD/DEAH box helicase family protein n=1 Tax=Mammaliicoccus lentus TaxID=42858 RepID=UPI002B259E01|nr:DEAD/DEAH box helicase family protein [Mammaliicoccus lentus]WQK51577.1 DEAD/DEAH box helicase family protein [Mammaliicoccus lentus]
MNNEILHKQIEEQFNSVFTPIPEVPNYILDNLNHELRSYQKQAISHLIFTQESDVADMKFKHLLFHMATGSGKTLVLAASMLYLFKKFGKQNFVFFVHTDAIIRKTHDNLVNTNSSKYLFKKEGINIDGNIITIQLVDVFPPVPNPNTIYLKLTTIQKLHGDLEEAREDSLTYESLQNIDIVLLADEAHHYFSATKRNQRNISKTEEEIKSWEKTIKKTLSLRPKNRLLGFSATFNLSNDVLFENIKDKIVYQYDLKKFMEDGFSKNVMLLRADEPDENKMLHGILLNQYRKYIAQNYDIDLKPIILFKSNTIDTSLTAHKNFTMMLDKLNPKELDMVINKGYNLYKNQNNIWSNMFSFYKEKNLNKVVSDLQWDFSEGSLLNANTKEFLSEDNALYLNSLEDKNNPIRAVFAVAKLNEGWDVLNLFDIVRISEGASKTKVTTDSEAQLIGRGARYFPYMYNEEKSYNRRFDIMSSDLKILESLHYHTINDNSYIQHLEQSLEDANIQVKEDSFEKLSAKVKPEFKKTSIFKEGKIYINKLISTTIEDYNSLADYGAVAFYDIPLTTTIEQKYGEKAQISTEVNRHEVTWKVDKIYIQKAIQRHPFFQFSNLKKYMPAISSMKDFIENKEFLGDLKLYITLPIDEKISDISPIEKLKMVENYMESLEKKIRKNYMKERGTPIFEGVSFSKLINDYQVELSKVNTSISRMSEVVRSRNMRDHNWYIYDKAIVNSWESSFIDFINDYIDELKQKYQEVYLIRNERKVKIVEIDGTRGFMPDFLLYLKDKSCTYQVFLEPKGDHLRRQDQWKEDLLISLSERDDIEILAENNEVRLLGIKFYSETTKNKKKFREDFKDKLL